jgi:hypothetical protein
MAAFLNFQCRQNRLYSRKRSAIFQDFKETAMRSVVGVVWGLLGAFCLSTPASADTATFPLKHISASTILRYLGAKQSATRLDAPKPTEKPGLLSPGIQQITIRDADRTLVARGTANALNELRTIVLMFDIKPREIRLKVSLVRVRFTKEDPSSWDIETLATSTFQTANNTFTPIQIRGKAENFRLYRFSLLPRLMSDDTITMFVRELNLPSFAGVKNADAVQITRSVPIGGKTTLFGVTDSANEAIQQAITRGQFPAIPDTHTTYYLQVTPTLVPIQGVN